DRLTSLTDPLGQTTQLGYDPAGNQTSMTSPLGHTTHMSYDNLYRLVQLVNANGEITSYTHDLAGNLLTHTDPLGNVATMNYDPLNRLLSQTNQSGNTRTLAYDAVGNQTSRTDGNGRVRTFTYDALNRLTSETWVGDGYTASYSYDPASQLTQASDPFASYSLAYDGAGRLTNRAETVTGLQALRMVSPAAVSFDLGYDEAGNRVTLGEQINGQPTAVTTTLFDALNRPVRLTQEGAGVAEKRIEMGYDSASRLTQLTRFADVAGAQQVVNTAYGYDAENKLTSISHQPSGGPALNYGYSYDTADRLTQMTTPEGTSSFTYDEFDQLLAAVHSFQTDESYTYDDNGNRTNHTIGSDNRLLNDGTFSYTYDGEGNRTSKTHLTTNFVTEYSWDYRQRLTQIVHKDNLGNVLSSVAYTYNIFDERIGRTDSTGLTQQFVVLGGSVQLVLDGDGEVTNRYLHGSLIDMVLVDEQVGGATLYPLADHQMTARHLLGGDGTVVNQRRFDSFGNLVGESNTAVAYLFGYTGRETDTLADLSYYRARYYDPQVGKFLSEDPIGLLAGDPNLTRYVGNNPTLVGDPSGLLDLDFFADGADAAAEAAKKAAEEARFLADNAAEIAAENAKLKNMMAEMLSKRLGISIEDAAAQGKVLKDALLNEDAIKAAKNAQKLADDIAMRAAREAAEKAATDPGLLSKMFGTFAAHAGSINAGFAVADYAEVAMHSVAEMYMAQARIMAQERVEAHRAEMERRMLAIHNERMRQHNEEVRRQLAAEQEARNREIEAERAQQIQQDALIIGQHLREQQFLEEQQRRRRGRMGPSAEDVQRALLLHQAVLLQKEARGDPQPTGLPPREPESNQNGMVGFFNELAEKHGTRSPFATTPANSQKK
ncbi:MAG: hypothetical protein KDD89_08510, partial [Anaerolineales bacterium]|nr:hypothetical protein [Anaerolineales bacterium]